ncbi:MAG: hypothetical protein UHD64_05855, partial [Bacteroidales bacterium]|nr:hypothetical protein [Bacteroidales bacterium]
FNAGVIIVSQRDIEIKRRFIIFFQRNNSLKQRKKTKNLRENSRRQSNLKIKIMKKMKKSILPNKLLHT